MIPTTCKCGHDLGAHPPDPARPFSWPCRLCECREYVEKALTTIYILDAASQELTMKFVRISQQNGHETVYEGLTNR